MLATAAVAASPAAAQDAAAGESKALEMGTGEQGSAPIRPGTAWSAERGFVELERLQAEVRMLRALAGVQAALLAWNRVRAEGGAGPAVLPAALCGEPEIEPWCRALSATFGPDAGRAVPEAEREEGSR